MAAFVGSQMASCVTNDLTLVVMHLERGMSTYYMCPEYNRHEHITDVPPSCWGIMVNKSRHTCTVAPLHNVYHHHPSDPTTDIRPPGGNVTKHIYIHSTENQLNYSYKPPPLSKLHQSHTQMVHRKDKLLCIEASDTQTFVAQL
ncbi:hypothetical protein CBL_10410 [Carabus blaptoides fortunei]